MEQLFQGLPSFLNEFVYLLSGTAQSNPLTDTAASSFVGRVVAAISSNPFLFLFLGSLLPRIFAILQTLYAASVEYITRSYYVSLEIDRSQDDIYFRILEFVFEEQMKDLHKRLRRAQGVSKVQNSQQTIYRPYNDSAPPRPEISFMPKLGTTLDITYKNYVLQVTRRESKPSPDPNHDYRYPFGDVHLFRQQETIEISMRGSDLLLLQSIVQEWIDTIYYRNINKLTIYQCMRDYGTEYEWIPIAVKEMRRFDSIVLRNGLKEEILADVQKFLKDKDLYGMRGIPYRRAVILYGPPGTGKTSLVQGLAQMLHMNLAYISLSVTMDDEAFRSLLAKTPHNSIIVMEDFDRFHIGSDIKGRKDAPQETPSNGNALPRITEAGLLNVLDGVGTPEGSLIFLTCNNISKLGDAMRRPGRIDQLYHLSYADEYQIEEMFWRFFGTGKERTDADERQRYPLQQKIVKEFSSLVTTKHNKVTTAMLQKLFMEFEKDEQAKGKRRVTINEQFLDEAKASSSLERLVDSDYLKGLLDRVDPSILDNTTPESAPNSNIPLKKH